MRVQHSYHDDLRGLYLACQPEQPPAPRLIIYNDALADELDLHIPAAKRADYLSGKIIPRWARPLAQAYSGHQFGQFNPQLGDGRALLLGEVIGKFGTCFDIQLKGSGRTAFSRNGDGRAALGPVLREYLIAEAMHALGVPSTRALAAVQTGAKLQRESIQQGAVLTRVAASHIRIGTFQFFAARGDVKNLRKLLDYTIARHYPNCIGDTIAFLRAVMEAQAALIAKWMGLGFIHGVMNTDNMSIAGQTIDYGPCAFMDRYAPDTVFSSIDTQGRYRYKNQPLIAQWNLARLAEALLALIDSNENRAIEQASAVLEQFNARYKAHWLAVFRAKLGLEQECDGDAKLIEDLLADMHETQSDFTQSFRALAKGQAPKCDWKARFERRIASEKTDVYARIAAHNPIYIPRNHAVEAALSDANAGDFGRFFELHKVLLTPFTSQSVAASYAQPPKTPDPNYRTFCGT